MGKASTWKGSMFGFLQTAGPIESAAHCSLPLLQGKVDLGWSEANPLWEANAHCSFSQQGWGCCLRHDQRSICICGAWWSGCEGINGRIGDVAARTWNANHWPISQPTFDRAGAETIWFWWILMIYVDYCWLRPRTATAKVADTCR